MKTTIQKPLSTISLLILVAIFTSGCVTVSRHKWNERTGSYTIDDAMRELGPAQKAINYPDGSQLGIWLTRAGTYSSIYYFHRGPAFSGRVFDGSYLPISPPNIPDEYIRLLFAPDNTLITWDRTFK